MRVMSADEWERELAQKIAEEKQTEADWKLLTKQKTNIKKAIAIYEGFVSELARYPLPYLRLPIIYRKEKNYKNEVRVLQAALIVFARDNDERNYSDAAKRLDKARALLSSSHL